MEKPFAQSCEENRAPILAELSRLYHDRHAVLEVGSGTGQHAVYFAPALPHLVWHTSDRAENHAGIRRWLEEAGLPNVRAPLLLDVLQPVWPEAEVDAVFSANTVHIMAWPMVEALFAGVGARLPSGGLFTLYGPFNYHGGYTSESNARFDAWLKGRDPESGIRDFEALERLAVLAGMLLQEDRAMPCNNRLLSWRKR